MPFTEIADRVWVLRHEWFDLNVSVVGGERGLVVVDTHASATAAREVIDELRRLDRGAPVAIVNTHEHFDHTFGNATLLAAYDDLPIHATDEAAARTITAGERIQEAYRTSDDPRASEVVATTIRPADRTFSSTAVIDLGDRQVELVHPGRGHTGGDLVARVGDVDVLIAGDLIEESAPPAIGADSYPLEWPQTLDLVLGLLTPSSLVVPGHGAVVDRRFVEEQCDELRAVAETLRELASQGVPEDQALASAEWPFPIEGLENAVRRAYSQLPRARRQLPLA
ncbi:MBL fold metallo-hydrolase [Nocardioides caeni]|uniref:MBL fold metallo-hydrolase n=1 Tax=Nocardioides caeni TaxID=574700 RepID=A0A4S8NMF1_9ACTN|nr:MBL fold metallo-hydrolase [Nocardioides caeni]THV17641.1 MBL fold metallo-hydrolase [Nocardioides caeni]